MIIGLVGMTSTTLGNYLAALGLERIVAEQVDGDAALSWQGHEPRLHTSLGVDELTTFFCDQYRPTPLVAPWNGSSFGGFKPGADDRHAKARAQLADTTGDRFEAYREVFETTSEVVAGSAWVEAMSNTNKQAGKAAAIRQLRNRLPDDALGFLDAAVALTSESPSYPPVLGTGGNIGRLDLVVSCWENLLRVAGMTVPKRGEANSAELFRASCFGDAAPLVKATFAQFDAKSAGGANEARLGDAPALVNPWTFLLAIEGAILMAAAVSRRLGSDRSVAVAPFSVAATSSGFQSQAEEGSGGEFWAPQWTRPARLGELRMLLGEGRATWNGSQARRGVDFLRAVRTVGVDRGVSRFVRFGFPERNGQMRVAVPLGEYSVADDSSVRLTASLDAWVSRLRSVSGSSARISTSYRQLEHDMFAAAEDPRPDRLRTLLARAVEAERVCSRSTEARERGMRPVPLLEAGEWLPALDDRTTEFRVALALTSGRARNPGGSARIPRLESSGCLAEFLRPVRRVGHGVTSEYQWADGPALVSAVAHRPMTDVLADVAVLRSRVTAVSPGDNPDVPFVGCRPQFPGAYRCSLADAEALATGTLDGELLRNWIWALMTLGPVRDRLPGEVRRSSAPAGVAPLWRLVAPFFESTAVTVAFPDPAGARAFHPTVPTQWPSKLRAGRCRDVMRELPVRLTMAGGAEPFGFSTRGFEFSAVECRGALAAAMVPIQHRAVAELLGARHPMASVTHTTSPTDPMESE